jgi:putative LysE/RhtB family amino acid efflux pump
MALFFSLMKAWMIGFAIAAPVGPIGVLCIKNTLESGFFGTMAVGLGAALANSFYGFLAAAGVSVISTFLMAHSAAIRMVGGLLLLAIAFREISKRPPTFRTGTAAGHKNFWKLCIKVIFLTLTNPLTIVSYIGVFASISSGEAGSLGQAFAVTLGIFFGAMSWWIALGLLILSVSGKIPKIWLQNIRYASAMIIGSFGLWSIFSGMASR